MADAPLNLHERAWNRAKRDAHLFPETPGGRVLEVLVLTLASVLVPALLVGDESMGHKIFVGVATAVAGGGTVALLMFLDSLRRAPIKQRNEARDEVRRLRAQIDTFTGQGPVSFVDPGVQHTRFLAACDHMLARHAAAKPLDEHAVRRFVADIDALMVRSFTALTVESERRIVQGQLVIWSMIDGPLPRSISADDCETAAAYAERALMRLRSSATPSWLRLDVPIEVPRAPDRGRRNTQPPPAESG